MIREIFGPTNTRPLGSLLFLLTSIHEDALQKSPSPLAVYYHSTRGGEGVVVYLSNEIKMFSICYSPSFHATRYKKG